jgi:hypothetical protein
MKTVLAGLAGAMIATMVALPAAADEIPNLVGTWKGTARAVHIGPTPYRIPDGPGPTFGGDLEFTYVIKEQQDGRFAGETEGKYTEQFLGALQPPAYQSGVMVDSDGDYTFTLRDATTMDACYRHVYPSSKVVACFTLTKQP